MASTEQLRLVANAVRGLAMDAVQKANSGHPGMPMGMADVATYLWLNELRFAAEEPDWAGRDRFVLSAGHGSMLQYALLHLAGFDLPKDELRNFRQLHSRTPGHPEYGLTPGVETTTGPLGQGFANGVGLALGSKMAAARFDNPQIETRVLGIVSDGDLMEGISSEAASLAGHLGLGNLCYFYDDNRITIDGSTELSFTEQVEYRFQGFGWRVLRTDGHDFEQISQTARDALGDSEGRPTLVVCRTHIAYGSPNKQDTADSHGAPLGTEEIALSKAALGLPAATFHVPDEAYELFRATAERNQGLKRQWEADFEDWEKARPELAKSYHAFCRRATPDDLLEQLCAEVGTADGATRALGGKVIQAAAALVPSLVGGSADLAGSCKTTIKDSAHVSRDDASGRNLHFGVREHAMGAIVNGLSLHGGYLPVGSTFLVFSDYMRPAIRLAALMQIPATFVFTHDSVMVGEDGPTHQPIEQVSALRLIPNLHVFRPADGVEVAAAWTHALKRRNGPVAMCLTRQGLPALQRPADFDPHDVLRGGYVLRAPAAPVATLIATGSEVALACEVADRLGDAHPLRIISMPCVELFAAQDRAWRHGCIDPALPAFAIEMGRPELWTQFTGDLDRVIGMQRFGASAPAKVLAEHFGFTAEAVAAQLRESLQP